MLSVSLFLIAVTLALPQPSCLSAIH
jgi:hypothetical protein